MDGFGNPTLYVNGASQGLTASGASASTGAMPFTIGRPGAYNGQYFPGKSDDVGLWLTQLSAGQIAGLANGTTNPNTLSPYGLWRFEEGTGTTAADQGSGGHNGTLTNGPTWSTDVPSQLQ
jgi:hypothetical protein